MNTAALSIIDIANLKILSTVLLDDEKLGAANPWSVACSKDGQLLCVTHAGTHELSVIDRLALHDKISRIDEDKISQYGDRNVSEDFHFLTGIRSRIKLAGKGPRGLVLIGDKAFVAEYFSDSIGVVDILPGNKNAAISVRLGVENRMSIERKGEMLFHDASYCRQHWQSCSSCHPDGRADGLNWDLLNDGIGNPKNTKSLLLAHRSSHAMWLGVRESVEEAVRAGFRFIEFCEVPEQDAVAVDAYLKSLQPVPSPHLVNGKLSNPAVLGKKVFEKAGCIQCHIPPQFAREGVQDIGTGTGLDKGKPFTTPSLIEVWRTAPYLHDGRAATMRDVITKFNKGDLHGATSSLNEEEIKGLIEYVLSL